MIYNIQLQVFIGVDELLLYIGLHRLRLHQKLILLLDLDLVILGNCGKGGYLVLHGLDLISVRLVLLL